MCWWPNNLISHLILVYEQQIENCLAINIQQKFFSLFSAGEQKVITAWNDFRVHEFFLLWHLKGYKHIYILYIYTILFIYYCISTCYTQDGQLFGCYKL